MNDVTITTGASRVLEDLKAWGIKATSIWTHFDDSANEWWSFLGRRSSHLAAPLRRGFPSLAKKPSPGVPNCPAAEDGRPSARNVSVCATFGTADLNKVHGA